MIKPPTRANKTQLSQIAGVSVNTISKHIRKAGLKQGKDKKYSVSDVLSAMAKHQEADNNNKSGGNKLAQGRAMKVALECKKLKIIIDELEGKLQETEEFRGWINENIGAAKKQLLSLPSALAPRLVNQKPAKIEALLKKSIRDILEGISNYE